MATRSANALELLNLAHTHPAVFDELRYSKKKNQRISRCEELLDDYIDDTNQTHPVPPGQPDANNFAFWDNLYPGDAFGAILGGLLLYLVLYRYARCKDVAVHVGQ